MMITMTMIYLFYLFEKDCRPFFTVPAEEGYIMFLTQMSDLSDVVACTQSEGSEFYSSTVPTKHEYLKVLFLGACGLTIFEGFNLADRWGGGIRYKFLFQPDSL